MSKSKIRRLKALKEKRKIGEARFNRKVTKAIKTHCEGDEADRCLQRWDILQKVLAYFDGCTTKTQIWYYTEHPGLDGLPIDLIDTDQIADVEQLIDNTPIIKAP